MAACAHLEWSLLVAGAILFLPNSSQGLELFRGGNPFALGGPGGPLVAVDVNLDGREDVIAVAGNSVDIFLGDPQALLVANGNSKVGVGPVAIVAGDVNGDTFPDGIVANSGSFNISILLSMAGEKLVPTKQIPLVGDPRSLTLTDFNLDGNLDLAVGEWQTQKVEIFSGDGAGFFMSQEPISLATKPHGVLGIDFGDTGVPGLVVAHGGGVSWFQGSRNGLFDAVGFNAISPDPRFLDAADLDDDGRTEVLVLAEEGSRSLLFLKKTDGKSFESSLLATLEPEEDGRYFAAVTARDLNADGAADIAAAFHLRGESVMQLLSNQGGARFQDQPIVHLGTTVAGLSLVDLDADGLVDIVATQAGADALVYFQGEGAMHWSLPAVMPLKPSPRDVVLVDVNRDGLMDLLAPARQLLHLVLQNSTGGFDKPTSAALPGSGYMDAASADFDGDGYTDLALVDLPSNKGSIVFFDESGTISRRIEHDLRDLPADIVAGDFDADGHTDIAVADRADPSVTVILQPATTETAISKFLNTESGQTAIASGDLDLDGAVDLIVAGRVGGRAFLNEGKGAFPKDFDLPSLEHASSLRVADIDGDGAADVVSVADGQVFVLRRVHVAGETQRTDIQFDVSATAVQTLDDERDASTYLLVGTRIGLIVLTADEAGGFRRAGDYSLPDTPGAIEVGHFDGDAWADAAVANLGAMGSITILRGKGPDTHGEEFLRGDADRDLKVSITDAIVILRHLFLGSGPLKCEDAADVDDSGQIDITDSIALLGYLFLGTPHPPAPGPLELGPDPTPDTLHCQG